MDWNKNIVSTATTFNCERRASAEVTTHMPWSIVPRKWLSDYAVNMSCSLDFSFRSIGNGEEGD